MTQEPHDPIAATVITTSPADQRVQPAWIGEAAVILDVAAHTAILQGLRDRVRVPRGRMGTFEACDFVLVLILFAVSRAQTLKALVPDLRGWGAALAGLWSRRH